MKTVDEAITEKVGALPEDANSDQITAAIQQGITEVLVAHLLLGEGLTLDEDSLKLMKDKGLLDGVAKEYMQEAASQQSGEASELVFSEVEGHTAIGVRDRNSDQPATPERTFVFDVERSQIIPLQDFQAANGD
jgi:hypothetical protein